MESLSKEERIALRDELIDILIKNNIIIKNKNKKYIIHSSKYHKLKEILSIDNNLYQKYNFYVQQFRSEDEALYCIIHKDDFENHLCSICGNVCLFYHNLKHNEYRNTCGNIECHGKLTGSIKAKEKRENTCLKLYNDKNYRNINKMQQTVEKLYGSKNIMKTNIGKESWRNSYQNNNKIKNLVIINECYNIFNQIKENINSFEIYSNDQYFIQFIKLLYKNKNRLLKIEEICNIFNLHNTTIGQRINKLNLQEYFDIKDSNLELQFEKFLENNNIKFIRHKFILETKNNTKQQLDFILKDYNIAFEINDIESHNSKQKDKYYHLNKTLQCKEKGIRLIHLWEWELTDEDLCARTSNWILNLLNNSKIQIDIKDCTIKEVNQIETQNFLNKYNLYNYIQSDILLGLYYQNELLQIMTFKHQINNEFELLRFSTKFGYEIEFGAKELLDHFIKKYNPSQIVTTINFDKFTGKTYEEIGFKLIEYIEPQLITHDSESLYKSIYNCGQNIYILNLK